MAPRQGTRMLTRSRSDQAFTGIQKMDSCSSEEEKFVGTEELKERDCSRRQYGVDRTNGGTLKKTKSTKELRKKMNPARMDSMQNAFSKMDMVPDDESIAWKVTCCQDSSKLVPNTCSVSPLGYDCQESIIVATQREEECATFSQGPTDCTVLEPRTGKRWFVRGNRVKLYPGHGSTMVYWKLTSTQHTKSVFVFGYRYSNGTIKYLTARFRGFKLLTNSKDPASIDVDSGEETKDKRAFYLEKQPGSSQQGDLLVLATKQNKTLSARGDKLRKLNKNRNSTHWEIH